MSGHRTQAGSYAALERLGRVRLSRHFTMRDCLYSEIAAAHGLSNLPDDPDIAIAAGRALCETLLEPLHATFGAVTIRSAYRSSAVNAFGNAHGLNCSRNAVTHACHIWDRRDAAGRMGATACIIIPWFADRYDQGRDWRDLAWWVHDHLPYASMTFFPKRAAFNLQWREQPDPWIKSFVAPRGLLYRAGDREAEPGRAARYADFPAFVGGG